jgi:integrase/recombinase XerD
MEKFDFSRRKSTETRRQFNLEQTIEKFLDAKRLQRRSEKTIKSYKQTLYHFAKFCADHGLTGVEYDCVKHYIKYMTFEKVKWDDHPTSHSDEIGVSSRTINNIIRNIRIFYNWAEQEKLSYINPAAHVEYQKENEESFDVFTDEEVKALLDAPNKRIYTGFRDYVMMLVLVDTGVRVGELTTLKRCDVDLLYRQIILPAEITKARRARVVPISPTTAKALGDLFDMIGADDSQSDEYIFLTQFGERYYGDTFAKMLKKYAKKSGYPIKARVSPHTFRHYFAIKFLRNGGDPFALMKILGHTDMAMTQRYVRYAKSEVMDIHEKASPVEAIISTRNKRKGSIKFK